MPTRWIILAFFLCAALPAQAQQDDLFARLDQNRDGRLSSQELESDAASRGDWIAVDRNRDGVISRGEFGTVPVARSGGRQGATGATRAPADEDRDKSATGSGRP